jgi:hypothetical protein
MRCLRIIATSAADRVPAPLPIPAMPWDQIRSVRTSRTQQSLASLFRLQARLQIEVANIDCLLSKPQGTLSFFEPLTLEPLTLCHVERSRSECDDVVETSRECQSPKMQTQGVLPNIVLVTVFLVPIVPPDPAKAGSWFRPRFFSKRQRTLTFSSPSPSVMLSAVGANADDVVETSRECQSPKMQTQGVLPKDCPRNRISRPHCSARSCQRGFVVSTKVFFEAPKNPNLFEPLPSVMLSGVGANATT